MSMRARVTINAVRICVAVNPRFPGQGHSSQGQSEPKARPKGVVDGRRVNIPVPVGITAPQGVVAEEGWRRLDEPGASSPGLRP